MRMKIGNEERIKAEEVKELLTKLSNGEISKGACIRYLFAGGLSVKEISECTGIRYNHVYNVCSAEITKNHLEPDVIFGRDGKTKKEQILELLNQGKTVTEVSKELGCLYNQVWQVAKAANLTKKQQQQQEQQEQQTQPQKKQRKQQLKPVQEGGK